MPPNPRVTKAFKAMKVIGIHETTVKPVLKRLLKLYDRNWELIEAEEYRALADAIFEEQDAEVSGAGAGARESAVEENTVEEVQVHDEHNRPSKRLRKGLPGEISLSSDNCNSGLVGGPLIKPIEEKEELLGTNLTQLPSARTGSQSLVVSPQNLATNMGKQAVSRSPLAVQHSSNQRESHVVDRTLSHNSVSPQKRHAYKEEEPLVRQAAVKGKSPVLVGSSTSLGSRGTVVDPDSGLVLKEKVYDTLALVLKDEPFTEDMPQYELPLALITPDSSDREDLSPHMASTGKLDGFQSSASHLLAGEDNKYENASSSRETRANCAVAIIPEESPGNLEIAASSMGEVKISLSCNSLVGRPNFRMPSQAELLKSMEEKCLHSYRILDPKFSVMKMLKDMFQCFLELAIDSSCESRERLLNVTPRINLLKRHTFFSFGGAVGNGHQPANTSNGSVDIRHVDEVEMPLPSVEGLRHILSGNEVAAEVCFENKKGEELRDPELCGLVAVPQCQLTPEEFRSLYCINDITKGEEVVEIPWLNEISDEYLSSFNYIPRNLVFQNALVNFSLSQITAESCCSSCISDCLLSSTPCVCSSETMHDFAYTRDGIVKEDFLEDCISMHRDPKRQSLFYCRDCPIQRAKGDAILEPCQGHLRRRCIKECWSKCGCIKQCGNRVVQQGIRCKLQVFFTPEGKGWGLRTVEKLPKGAFVCEYVGEILTTKEFFERKKEMVKNDNGHACPTPLDAHWCLKGHLKNEEALCLDATFHGNVARFINHQCLDANLIEIPVKIESPDHHYYHLAFFTTREVNALEELTLDYGIDFDGDNNDFVESFPCLCGSKFCRDMRRSNRSRSAAKLSEA